MIKGWYQHLVGVVRIWLAPRRPRLDVTFATTGRYHCVRPSAGRRGSISKPRAYLTRRYAEGRGNKDVLD